MKKTALFFVFLLLLSLFTHSLALTNEENVLKSIAKASTDDLLLLRELIDAELDRRYTAIKSIREDETTYILNISSKKFHIPSCSSVKKTKEQNKKEYQGTRDELISLGYKPCGNCNP